MFTFIRRIGSPLLEQAPARSFASVPYEKNVKKLMSIYKKTLDRLNEVKLPNSKVQYYLEVQASNGLDLCKQVRSSWAVIEYVKDNDRDAILKEAQTTLDELNDETSELYKNPEPPTVSGGPEPKQ